MNETLQWILVAVIVIAAVWSAYRSGRRTKGGCSNCKMASECCKKKAKR